MERLKAVAPLLSTATSFLLLVIGAAALYTMMVITGKKDASRTAIYTKMHRIAGWSFVMLFFSMFIYMLTRVAHYNEEFSARITIHLTLAIALLSLLVIKITIPRFFPNLGRYLFFLGSGVYLLAFPMVLISGGYHVEKMVTREPYVYHADFSKDFADDNLGKEFLITKCSTCHTLQSILKPRSEKAWKEIVNRMVLLAMPRISTDEASQILSYLAKNFIPREIETKEGSSLIEKHCLPCHAEKDIYKTPYGLTAWKAIIRRMSSFDERIVPSDRVDEIAVFLVKTQGK